MSSPSTIGRYRVVGPLATGGMAEVLLGKLFGPSGFERVVVIKRVLPHLAQQKRFVSMFTDEARIVSHIRHPNVVSVSEFGAEGGELFLVMEYLEGEALDSVIRRMRSTGRQMDFSLAAHIGAETCAGLHAAHELKDSAGQPLCLVHRDISPQNIFITYDGHIKIIDFGIAKATHRDTLTEVGDIKGKFAYMAPEQCRGENLDRRTDLFALGIVLYELTTGRRLFARANAAMTTEAICNRTIPNPSSLVHGYPKRLDRCLMYALNRDMGKRFANAATMQRELLEIQREMDGNPMPEQALATLMQTLFEERIEEKRAMLRGVSSGLEGTTIPAAGVDLEVEVPTVALGPNTNDMFRRKMRGLITAGAIALTAALIGMWWNLRNDSGTPNVAVPSPPEKSHVTQASAILPSDAGASRVDANTRPVAVRFRKKARASAKPVAPANVAPAAPVMPPAPSPGIHRFQ